MNDQPTAKKRGRPRVPVEKQMRGRYIKCPCCNAVIYYDWKSYVKPTTDEIKAWKERQKKNEMSLTTEPPVECEIDKSSG